MRIAICNGFKLFIDIMSQNIRDNDEIIEMDVFEDGKYLLENFTAGKYDIIILDYYMNEMGGLQSSMKIRKIAQKVIIIFATTEVAVNMGVGDVFLKLERPITQGRFKQGSHENIDLSGDFDFFTTKTGNQIRIDKIANISWKIVEMCSGDKIIIG